MGSVEKKYKVICRCIYELEIFVEGRNEEEAAYSAGSIELDRWNQVDSSLEVVDVSRVFHLILVKDKEGQEISRPIIKIWERT
jgi:hypothetical protein